MVQETSQQSRQNAIRNEFGRRSGCLVIIIVPRGHDNYSVELWEDQNALATLAEGGKRLNGLAVDLIVIGPPVISIIALAR